MSLNLIPGNRASRRKFKRLGRGIGSGKGKTCGHGVKGQKAREGVSLNGFEGGQLPLYRRLPKRGFNPINRQKPVFINLDDIARLLDCGKLQPNQIITSDLLYELGVIRQRNSHVKLLSRGSLNIPMQFNLHAASKAAALAVDNAKGSLTIRESISL